MAKKPGQAKSLRQLREEVAQSRNRLATDIGGLRYELDFPLKFRKSFQRQTIVWVGAALAGGIAAAIIPAKRKKAPVRAKARNDPTNEILGAGLALGALKVALTIFKPVLTKFVAKKVSEYVARS